MSTLKQPDGPQTHPWLQTLQWLANPLGYMEACAQRYGDIFTLRIGPVFTPQVFISNPQAIQEIFSTEPKQLDSGEEAGIKSPLLGRQSLVAIAGERHRRRRKLLMPPFHGERMRAYGQLVRDITEKVTGRWTIGEPFSVRPSMQAISFEVILKAVFGLEEGSRYETLQELLSALLNPKNTLLQGMIIVFPALQRDWGTWSPWGQLMRQLKQIDDLIYAEIAERRAQPDPSRTDILSMMMSARDEAGETMTDVELRDELMTAKQFKPERFLERQFAPYEYLPFGGGNRACIGMAFAQFEMKLVLATVLSRWQLELADSKPVEPVRKGALLGPAQGVPIVVRGKRPENQRILLST